MKITSNMAPGKPRSGGQTGRSRLALAILCAYWVGIFIVSHVPKPYVPAGWSVSGTWMHAGAYFVLTLLVFASAGLLGRLSLGVKKTWLLIGVIGAYAGLDEFLQLFIKGRDGNFADWVVDISVCLVCVGLLWIISLLRRRAEKSAEISGHS